MGKTIIQQARGHGSFSYRVRRNAFRYKLQYARSLVGEGTVVKLFHSAGHSAPLAKIKVGEEMFYIPACKGMFEEMKITFDNEVKDGNILQLKNIPVKTFIYDIESRPGDGGMFIKTAGSSATVSRIIGENARTRIKELKADFGLDAFNLRDFWATEAALGFAMLAYNLMSLFRQAVLRSRVQHTLSTLHGLVLAIGASWHKDASQNRLMLSVPRRKRAWFAGLWANASAPPVISGLAPNG